MNPILWSRKVPPPDNIYKNIPEDDYHNWNCFSYSMVKHLKKSQKHLDRHMKFEAKELKYKPHIILGNMVECVWLEPKIFDWNGYEFGANSPFALRPDTYVNAKGETKPFTMNSNVCKDTMSRIISSGKTPVTNSQVETSYDILEELNNHPTVQELLEGCERQLSVSWTDEETGVQCKIRPDLYNKEKACIPDLKVTHQADFEGFRGICGTFGYNNQHALYTNGMELFDDRPHTFPLIAVESAPPHCITCIHLREDSIIQGRVDVKKAMREYAKMLESGEKGYEGYPIGIHDMDLRPYLLNRDNQGVIIDE